MSVNIGGGSVGVLPPTTPWSVAAVIFDNVYQDLYTVPANRKLYVTGIIISTDSTSTGAIIRIDSTDVLDLELQPSGFYPVPASATAPLFALEGGEVLKARSTAGGITYYNFSGYLL